jgi:hypothetical protein
MTNTTAGIPQLKIWLQFINSVAIAIRKFEICKDLSTRASAGHATRMFPV